MVCRPGSRITFRTSSRGAFAESAPRGAPNGNGVSRRRSRAPRWQPGGIAGELQSHRSTMGDGGLQRLDASVLGGPELAAVTADRHQALDPTHISTRRRGTVRVFRQVLPRRHGRQRRRAQRRRPRRAGCRSWRRPGRPGESKARPVMNNDTVKPIPATAPTPTTWPHRASGGSRASPSRTASQLNETTPTSLPTTKPTVTPRSTADGSTNRVRRQDDAGVGQREDRHDDIARPRVQRVDQPIARRHGTSDEPRRVPDVVGVELGTVLERRRRSRRTRGRSASAAPASADPGSRRRSWRGPRTRTRRSRARSRQQPAARRAVTSTRCIRPTSDASPTATSNSCGRRSSV